jgi:uncharacterized protein (DUF2147 family)
MTARHLATRGSTNPVTRRFALISLAAAMALTTAAPAGAAVGDVGLYGVWRNPKNSVHVKFQECGSATCGVVIWASPKAQADARKGGTEKLVGTNLLRNFTMVRPGVWKGRVFVPDLNGTFGGTAELVDASTLKARGCLFVGLGCKTQLWKRVDGAAD